FLFNINVTLVTQHILEERDVGGLVIDYENPHFRVGGEVGIPCGSIHLGGSAFFINSLSFPFGFWISVLESVDGQADSSMTRENLATSSGLVRKSRAPAVMNC